MQRRRQRRQRRWRELDRRYFPGLHLLIVHPPSRLRSPASAAAVSISRRLPLLPAAAAVTSDMRPSLALSLLFLALVSAPGAFSEGRGEAAGEEARVVSRIAFGSCANQSAPQPIWSAISDFDPQLFIWLGDNIYGDNRRPFRVLGKERTIGPWRNVPRFFPASEKELAERYRLQKSNPGYSALRRRAQVIGTWDDHDYGLNDAGKEFKGKNVSQKLLLDFLGEVPDSPRRKQAGVYASNLFGPKGKQIKVILLDTRYHRDPIRSDGTILGETQWAWLDMELRGPATPVTIIASSIQVISNLSATTGPLIYMECWGRFPMEKERLYKLIENSKRDGVFFISGDVHFAEITRYDCATGYPLYDLTSSGLTQAVEKVVPSLAFLVRVAAWLTPTTMRVYNSECRYKSCIYGKPNFGAIEIDWDATPQMLRLEVRDEYGNPVTGLSMLLSNLQISAHANNTRKTAGRYQHDCILEINLPWIVRHRLVILLFVFLADFGFSCREKTLLLFLLNLYRWHFFDIFQFLIIAFMVLLWMIISLSKRFIRKFKVD
ncbi:hypothetical protein Taro_029029 [Colocasia esculenta]|uniref:PhoD-like phosphatase metallophosphatase domain-containing protein n=1 Tax=Colocasia esculenta TaxID=4460 RepID=A0A843VIU0_COLES|nr:hypothetical protein [Colocasia esculenta]